MGDTATVKNAPPFLRGVQVGVAVEVEHANPVAGLLRPAKAGHGAKHQRAVAAEQDRYVTVGPGGGDSIGNAADNFHHGWQVPGA
jgi:hypothetical protein